MIEENELTPAQTSPGPAGGRDDPKKQASSQSEARRLSSVTSAGLGRRGTRRAAIVLLLATLIGAAAGAAGRTVVGDEYTSEAQVLWDANAEQALDRPAPSADANAMNRQVADQRAVMLSDVVVDVAAASVDADPDDYRAVVDVETAQDSNLITVSSTSSSPADSTAVVSALVDAYVAHVRSSGIEVVQDRLTALEPTIARLEAEVGPLEERLAVADPDDPGITALQSRYDRAAARLGDLVEQRESYQATIDSYNGQAYLVRAATEPTAPSSWSLTTSALIGATLGLAAGACLLALLRSRRTPSGAGGAVRPAA